MNAELARARVKGTDEIRLSKVPLEVVQLSVECVEPSNACYDAIGRSMSVNQLLFARIEAATKRRPSVTVILYDVDDSAAIRTATKLFASEDDAAASVAALVGEVAR